MKSQQRDKAMDELVRLIARYLHGLKDSEIPNTRVALVDDFGQWLEKQRDDR